jgi:hypothetical protein
MGNAGSSDGGSEPPSSDGGMAGMSFGLQNLELPWSTSGDTMPTGGAEKRASVGTEASEGGAGERAGWTGPASDAVHSQDHPIHSNGSDAGAGPESQARAPPRQEMLSEILAKGDNMRSSVRVGLEELREMDRPRAKVTGAAPAPTGAAASQKQLELLFQLKKENERLLELKRMYALRVAGADPERFLMLKENASRDLIPCLTRTPVGFRA